ncbi:MAG: endonuclease III [Firmicutes bacterium]|nr:endonuclease III [Bacillota bacterium]
MRNKGAPRRAERAPKGRGIDPHPSPASLARLCRLLCSAHEEPREERADFPLLELAAEPLAMLVATILSQATNDRSSRRAYAALRRAFPRWEDLLAASEEEIARSIASAGLAAQKARAIKAVLARLCAERGEPSLEFLRGLPREEARRYLLSLPGVGPKTAACVQLFSLGQAAFPVDTHIRRVAARLGLIPAKADPARAQAILEGIVRPADCLPLHLAMIRHGRRICRPKNPRCEDCPLRPDCLISGSGIRLPR